MSFIGTVGVVAQQGNQGVAPTSVSIATSSSGNYDESFGPVSDASGCSFTAMDISAQQWSNNTLSAGPPVDDFDSFDGCSAQSSHRFFAYLRATGATSYSWVLELTSQSLSNSCTASIVGTALTAQDCTAGVGVGETLQIEFGGGRGGQTYPAGNDTLVVTLKGTATNSSGSTGATNCVLTYTFIAL